VTKRTVSILERPVYGVVEAAGILGLRYRRARAWLDGYERRGANYPPVIREQATGSKIVTWGEFVELGYLTEYRQKGVPLQRLRPVIDELRREFQTPYPLATARVRTGITDGQRTEIRGGDLAAGAQIIVGATQTAADAAGGSASPFQPQAQQGPRPPGAF
jgi:hypothetical protein